ncbi:MAG: 50S ribosomal protein L6 [Candidatus Pacearchaeota archaeon]
MHEDIIEKINIPEGVEVNVNSILTIKGPKGELKKKFPVKIEKKDNMIVIEAKKATKNEKKQIKTAKAHIRNMIKGVTEGFEYRLQICSAHFPMTVNVEKDKLLIKNFLGETKERIAKLLPNTEVKIEGDIIKVTSADIEAAGQTAANIELATKIKERDRTRFQDGIWIIKKANKEIK